MRPLMLLQADCYVERSDRTLAPEIARAECSEKLQNEDVGIEGGSNFSVLQHDNFDLLL